ncbi:MAG: DUF1549 and DUF1553 domain-containing protein, partial [bacterium]|nr:DUF1549 and DUF1553 domain-containing protein [bacterium]
ADATKSLFYLKPTEAIVHGGGYRLDPDGPGAALLLKWIEQGAVMRSEALLTKVEVSPTRRIADNSQTVISLQCLAHFSDGTQRDVTRWTVFSAEDPSAVAVDADAATARVLRPGRHIVIARYLDQVVAIELLLPNHSDPQPLHAAANFHASTNFIDQHVNALLQTLGLPLSQRSEDSAWLRRLTLDLTGRLPAPETVASFVADSSEEKYQVHVERLLASDAFLDYWTMELAKLLRLRPQPNDVEGARIYHGWLRSQLMQQTPYDQMARSLLMASGNVRQVGPANFYRTAPGPREQAEFVSELFMGNRLRCANCHDHPLDRWTQDDYHGLATIFAKVELRQGEVVTNPSGSVLHPATGEDAQARIPGERFVDSQGSRDQFVEWLIAPDNPYFAKAIVNRLWKAMMGRGLVEPVDDLRATNPATHPQLLDALAEDFVAHGYSLQHSLKTIALSSAYARSSHTNSLNANDDRYYSHALRKPLAAEVLADAISDVLGVSETYGQEPLGTRAVALFDVETESKTLDVLGRCDRDASCESESLVAGGLPLKLHLLNGPLLNARIRDDANRLHQMLEAGQDPLAVIQEFYQLALARECNAEEIEFWQLQLQSNSDASQTRAVLEDFLWSLLTCQEFVSNH